MSLQTRLAALISAIGTDIKMLQLRVPPAGGTMGQNLRKKTNTDYDTEWATPTGGAGLAEVYIGDAQPTRVAEVLWMDTDEVAPATLNVSMDTWHLIGAAGEPVFNAGYSNNNNTEVAGFRKYPDGRVRLKGFVNGPSGGGTAFTLPVGYRPAATNVRFSTLASQSGSPVIAYVSVTSSGNVQFSTVSASPTVTIWDLSSIEFDTESVLQTASVAAQPIDTVHLVGGPGEPTFQNAWVNYDNSAAVPGPAGQRSLRFRKFPDGRVRVSGVIKNGTGAVVFTLPANYRPATITDVELPIACQGGMAYVSVQSNGTVAIAANTAGASVATYSYMEFEFDTETVSAYSTGTFPYLPITMDTWHAVGAAGEPAFNSLWTNYNSPTYQAVGFRKDADGRVNLRGLLGATGSIASSTAIFTLPVGYRPPGQIVFDTSKDGTGYARIDVQTNGVVFWSSGGSAVAAGSFIGLDHLSFDTESVFQIASVIAQPIDAWHYVDVPAGTTGEPKFQNSWINFDAPRAAGFRKYPDGRVRLKGLVKSGTMAQTIFTLPTGYRPPASTRFSIDANAGSADIFGVITIDTDGTVVAYLGGNTRMALDGIEFDTETVSAYATGFVQINAPPRVTSLPVSPVDGQEVYFVADAIGALWHLRYNAGSAAAYKWEFVGGASLQAATTVSATVTTTTAEAPDNLPRITTPLAGDWAFSFTAQGSHPTAGGYYGVAAFCGATNLTPLYAVSYVGNNGAAVALTDYRFNAITAGSVCGLKFLTSAATATITMRAIALRPIRVG